MKLVPVSLEDIHRLWEMQVEAFSQLYQTYQDTETSPATEPVERIMERFQQPSTHYYFIRENSQDVGAIRVVDRQDPRIPKRISPIFILPPYRNHGLAQQAILAVEELHGPSNWALDTILQEKGNCYLYEKMGYRQTGRTEFINDKMTLVFYQKD